MKLMKHITIALAISAIPIAAFGQFGVVVDPAKVDVACPDDECHVAPVFMGEGGFVGELADGFDMANFVVSCGNTTASGSAAGDSDDVVRQLFSMANGLACLDDGGSIQIHGLADGGWYWINDSMNSAVSPLIAKDALAGDEVMPTDPGGVTLTAGDYGTYVKHGSGRVGILPHFVPTAPVDIPEIPEPEAATVCMPEWDADDEVYFANENDCMLGDGGTTIVMTAMTSDGRSSEVNSVHRNPGGGADIQIALDLWGNGSGHIAGGTNPHVGWDLSVPSWYNPKPAPFQTNFVISLEADGSLGTDLGNAGVSLSRGGMMEVPGTAETVPAPDPETDNEVTSINDTATVEREDGFYMDSADANPQCVQNVNTITDGSGTDTVYYQFQPATGDSPVNLLAASFAAADASWEALETWVRGHNATATNTQIKTVSVANPGPDGHFGDDPETGTADSPDDESTDDPGTNYELPAVVCATTPGESTMRYVGATLDVSPTTTYCNRDNNRSALVYVLAYSARGMNSTTPDIDQHPGPGWRTGLNASTALQVHCPTE